MTISMLDYLAEAERRRDQVAQAQKENRFKQLTGYASWNERLARRSMARLGAFMARQGERLERRYAFRATPAPAVRECPPGHCRLARPLQIAIPVRAD